MSNAAPIYLSFGFARVARPVGDSGTTGGVKVDVGELVLLVDVELLVGVGVLVELDTLVDEVWV